MLNGGAQVLDLSHLLQTPLRMHMRAQVGCAEGFALSSQAENAQQGSINFLG